MATQEQKAHNADGEQLQFKNTEASINPVELLQDGLKGLDKFGGFQLIKGLINHKKS